MTDELTILRQYKDETDVYVARLEDNQRELLRTISAQATLLAEKDVLIDRLQQGALTTLRRVRELEIAVGAVDPLEHGQYAQPAFFPAGEDTPLFTQPDAPAEPGKRIELTYRALSVSSVDVCMDCIAYATPPGTVAGCWAHLEKMRERGEIPQTQYDEIRRMADFIEAD